MKNDCLICERVEQIKQNRNDYYVKELKTGYVVMGDYQYYKGYTLFLYKYHISELHELQEDVRIEFLKEMSDVAQAVFKAFSPKKLNYELLGNSFSHMHWHIFPRYENDPNITQPVWIIDKAIRNAQSTKPSKKELLELKSKLTRYL